MGFVPQSTIYQLRFADPQYDGLIVRAESCSVDEFLAMQKLAASGDQDSVEDLLRKFSNVLVEWNIEKSDGSPVPATFDGLKSQKLDLINLIVAAWMDAIAAVDNPLLNGSRDGASNLELSLGLASASQSLPNS
jgi:hypothetical protein